MDELLPSEVRARIVEEHRALREKMQSTYAAAAGSGRDGLRRELSALLDAAVAVVDIEDELLLPTLRTIDAWGLERARRLVAWHIDLRERVAKMRAVAADANGPLAEAAEATRGFIERLEADLGSQERLHLAKELLSELLIQTDFGGA